MTPGMHRYPDVDRVIYGAPFDRALGTLARETDTIERARRVLGNFCGQRRDPG